MEFRHEPDNSRFVAEDGERRGVLEYRRRGDGVLDYAHTYVPPQHRGGGTASRLVRFALDTAREEGFSVIPSCPFVAKLMDEHPEYESIRAGSAAGR